MGSGGKRRVETLVSAGGVVCRRVDGCIEAVLCGRAVPAGPGQGGPEEGQPSSGTQGEKLRWSLAKGTPDPGETLEETALREVREETGLEVALEASLGSIDYWFADRDNQVSYHKTVHYYLMMPVGGNTDRHDPEFDVVRWFPSEEALQALAYANEAEVLRRALEIVSKRRGS